MKRRKAVARKVATLYRERLYEEQATRARGKFAKVPEDILRGLNPKTVERANEVRLLKVYHNARSKELEFKVGGQTRTQYTVKIKAVPKGDERSYWKSDVLVSCTCRHWRYGGCEYHAHKGDYLYSPQYPIGTLEAPKVRDKEGHNFVCKHIYKALQHAKGVYFDMN